MLIAKVLYLRVVCDYNSKTYGEQGILVKMQF